MGRIRRRRMGEGGEDREGEERDGGDREGEEEERTRG